MLIFILGGCSSRLDYKKKVTVILLCSCYNISVAVRIHYINIICGDFNINYLENSNNKLQLDSLLATCNLQSVIDFPTRITNSSCTAIDNILKNKRKTIDFSIQSCLSGLSDLDAQTLTLNDIKIQNLLLITSQEE